MVTASTRVMISSNTVEGSPAMTIISYLIKDREPWSTH